MASGGVLRHNWDTSTRRRKVSSGWAQQAEARTVMRHHRGICHVCHHPGADQVDHVIPVAQGGADTPANKRPIHDQPCPTCGKRCHVDKTRAESMRARKPRRRAPEPHPGVRGGG